MSTSQAANRIRRRYGVSVPYSAQPPSGPCVFCNMYKDQVIRNRRFWGARTIRACCEECARLGGTEHGRECLKIPVDRNRVYFPQNIGDLQVIETARDLLFRRVGRMDRAFNESASARFRERNPAPPPNLIRLPVERERQRQIAELQRAQQQWYEAADYGSRPWPSNPNPELYEIVDRGPYRFPVLRRRTGE